MASILLARKKYKEDILLLSNYLFILYAFFLPISEFIAEQIFIINLILFLFYGDIKKKLLFAIKNKVVQAFLLFYFLHLFWLVGSQNFDVAFYKLKNYMFILYIIIYISMIKNDFKHKILSGFIAGVLFSEFLSYCMLLKINIPFIPINGYVENVPFMLYSTQYSLVLSLSLGLILYSLLTQKLSLTFKIIYSFFFISASINIFIISSKLGYGLYIISISTILLYLVKSHLSKKVFLSVFFIGILGYMIAYNTSSIFYERINTAYSDTIKVYTEENYTTPIGTRIGLAKASLEVFKNNYLFGVGLGNHIEAVKPITDTYEKFFSGSYQSGNAAGLESEFFETIVQFGTIGLGIFLLLFYRILSNKTDGIFSALKYLLVVIMLITSLPSYIFFYADIGRIFALLATLTLVTYHNNKPLET